MKTQDLTGAEFEDMNSFGVIAYPEFKKYVSEFFRMKESATAEGIRNGVKAITIYYLSLETNNECERYEAQLLHEMVCKEYARLLL